MKKNRKLLATIIIAVISIAHISAQNDTQRKTLLTGGIKMEANLSGFIVSGTSEVTNKMDWGITLGGFLNLDVSKHFSIQGELIYHYKSSSIDRNGEGKFQYLGMEIPMYAIYQWNLRNKTRIYAGIGPYTEFGFRAKLAKDGKTADLYQKTDATGAPLMLDSNSGFGIMAGYEFAFGLQINAGYKVSITNVLDANSNSFSLYPQTFSLGIGYRFGK